MPSIVGADLEHMDSPFHQELLGHVDGLIQNLELIVGRAGQQEVGKDDHQPHPERQDDTMTALWDKTTNGFNMVMGGLQAFLTGLHLDYSNLVQEAEHLERQRKSLETERDELIEKSHDLHCRIQYNALEVKLDQTFTDMERCTSVDSANCFKEEAQENLRRMNELIRTANLRKCLLDKEILNEMDTITSTFQDYQRERTAFVKELDLFDDVRRRKIYSWLDVKNPLRSDEEREMGESAIEFIDLSSRRRTLEPMITSNTLRMYSINQSLSFDLRDNRQRMEEMMSLQQRVDELSGVNHILPRAATATIDLLGTATNESSSSYPHHHQQQATSDHAYGDSPSCDQINHHETVAGKGLHRCPRQLNLATDPVTDQQLLTRLESALRWENNDGLEFSTTMDGTTTTITSDDFHDPASSTSRHTGSVQEEEEKGEEENKEEKDGEDENEDGGGSAATSLCGDAASQEKLSDYDDNAMQLHAPITNTPRHPDDSAGGVTAINSAMPRSSHLLLHHVESTTGLIGSPTGHHHQQLMFGGLVKKKSSGGPSSMTALSDGGGVGVGGFGGREADRLVQASSSPSHSHRQHTIAPVAVTADDRETRSQGGRPGSSSGNPRNSRDHLLNK